MPLNTTLLITTSGLLCTRTRHFWQGPGTNMPTIVLVKPRWNHNNMPNVNACFLGNMCCQSQHSLNDIDYLPFSTWKRGLVNPSWEQKTVFSEQSPSFSSTTLHGIIHRKAPPIVKSFSLRINLVDPYRKTPPRNRPSLSTHPFGSIVTMMTRFLGQARNHVFRVCSF